MRFGLIGSSYTARSSAVADEELINLYVETRESSGADTGGGTKSLLWTPGVKTFATFPTSPTRGSIEANGRVFVVAGNALYELKASGAYTSIGTVANDGNAASLAFNGYQVMVVTGGKAYCLTLPTYTLLDVTGQMTAIPLSVQFDDSYFVIFFQNSSKYQMSNLLDGTTWDLTLVNAVEVFPENVNAGITNHRELWVFGDRHGQVYQDTGTAEIFDAIPSGFLEIGCAGPFVPCRLDNSIFWVSEDERGARMAWRSNGYTPQRISTHAVEIDLGSYPTLYGMTTYAYQDGGHLFWVLYVPGSRWSWVYDVGEQLWHKRAQWNQDTALWSAHQGWNHIYAFGLHLVGDWASGNLYSLNLNNLDDDGTYIRRLRRAPAMGDEMKWIRHSQLTIDCEMGNLSTVNPTDDPGQASAILGPSGGGTSASFAAGGTPWINPENALVNTAVYASSALVATVASTSSTTATGTSSGGGAAWTTPENIDSSSGTASVFLTAGGAPVDGSYYGTASNSANSSNQRPVAVSKIFAGFKPTAATSCTLYVLVSGNVTAYAGGGVLTLKYSKDGGTTFTTAETWNATFAQIKIPITISGITDLSSVQVQIIAECSCAPTGFSNVSIAIPIFGISAIIAGSAQPTAQTLSAAVTGLAIPDNTTLVGLAVSINADYTGDAPTFQVGLNVGSLQSPVTLTTTPAIHSVGGTATLWGYDAWTNDTLDALVVDFYASSTGNTTLFVNQLTVTAYYVETNIPTDGLDLQAFGFTVPDTAGVQGITASLIAYSDQTNATITVQMLKHGTLVGDPQTLPLNTTASVVTFGGMTSLFSAQWQNSDFSADHTGIRITGTATGGQSATIYVGYSTLQLFCPVTSPTFAHIGPDPGLVDGDGDPRPPQMTIRWSDDRGQTWSNMRIVDCGKIGQYHKRAMLWRLGRSRYRVYEISMTDPIPWVVCDGYVEASE